MSLWSNHGYCLVCCSNVEFIAKQEWLRDHYVCSGCGSIPRQRALMYTLENYFPGWRDLVIHESSPDENCASAKLKRECKNYIPSHYFPEAESGSIVQGMRCEDLEKLSFPDESVDLHVTQDVIEHLFHPELAFKEIARTLKPGGAHLFSVPLESKGGPTRICARLLENGEVEHFSPPEYHDNPISRKDSLLVRRWGFDICRYIYEASGLFSSIVHIDDISKGIRAEFIEVVVTFKGSRH